MSISIGNDGRVVTGQTNVVIPPENAGVGDLIYGTRSDFKVIGRGTAGSATIDGRSLYGGIFGFVNGEAMVCAPDEVRLNFGASVPSSTPTAALDTIMMRNGLKTSNAQMNLSTNKNAHGTAGTLVHPTAANSGVLNESGTESFNANTNDVQSIYGSYDEYMKQLQRINGFPGSPFGLTATGGKVHEFGYWMGKNVFSSSTYGTSTAGGYSYAYREGGGTWWLPSMYELGELVIDEHADLLNENSGVPGWTNLLAYFYWSCVARTPSSIWVYNINGFSDYRSSYYELSVRPVTHFKLT